MPLVYVDNGLIQALEAITQYAESDWLIGLYQNDWTPAQGDTIGDVSPCDFDGYSGLEPLTGFITPTIDGVRAVTAGDPVEWTHDGGATSNLVYGYYVEDGVGNLILAERDPHGPRLMGALGDKITVTPRMTYRTEP